MAKLNHHYQKLSGQYLFTEIEKRIAALKAKTPEACLINLGIGDVTSPLTPTVVSALVTASQELGEKKSFRGYGPSEGYSFLRRAIAENAYSNLGICPDEIFISDGANSDLSNLQEIFCTENRIAVPDPSYPVYLDTNIMAGRTRLPLKNGRYGGVTYLPCIEETNFLSQPPHSHADLIYLCSPNNPTGTVLDKTLLKRWVDYAREHQAVIILDGAYEAFISSQNCPHSIYEIEGAKEVAIEVRSFSKSAGFTSLRCSYTVIPHQLKVHDAGTIHHLNAFWKRRVDTKSNGVSYPIQKAALATFSPNGKKEIQELINTYKESTTLLRNGLAKLGYTVFGGEDAPYVWCKTPQKTESWKFFDALLEKEHIIAVPGRGFGTYGEGYIRFSGYADPAAIAEGLLRLANL